MQPSLQDIADHIRAAPRSGRRRLVAIAGAPASGKSTIAQELVKALSCGGCQTVVVPMDGFHLHNQTLAARDLLNRKGAPETFDISGFSHLIARLQEEDEVFFPTFDRPRDIAIAGGGCVDMQCDTVIVEGNYLLLDAPGWRSLTRHWDVTLRLSATMAVLTERLVARWLAHGMSPEQAQARAAQNDLINARLVQEHCLPADIVISS